MKNNNEISNEDINLGLYVSYHILDNLGSNLLYYDNNANTNTNTRQNKSQTDLNNSHSNENNYNNKNHRFEFSVIVEKINMKPMIPKSSMKSPKLISPKAMSLMMTRDQSIKDFIPVEKSIVASKHLLLNDSNDLNESNSNKYKRNRQLRILIVDDSPICQKIMIRSLNNLLYDTDIASNGKVS